MMDPAPQFIDANVLLRYVTRQPEELWRRAVEIIEDGVGPLYIPVVALSEALFVLDRGERPVPRDRIIEAMRQVLQGGRLRVWELDTGRVLRSLEFCRPNRRVSFGDALVWAAVRSEDGLLYTFARHFPDEGIIVRSELLRPAEEPPPDHE